MSCNLVWKILNISPLCIILAKQCTMMHFYNALMRVLLFLRDARATLLKDAAEEELARIEREHTQTKGNALAN